MPLLEIALKLASSPHITGPTVESSPQNVGEFHGSCYTRHSQRFEHLNDSQRINVIRTSNAPVKLFCPLPPGHPWGHHFFVLPRLLIISFFPCPALYNHENHPFFEYPPFLLHTFSLWPRGCPREMGSEQFDRRINESVDTCHSNI